MRSAELVPLGFSSQNVGCRHRLDHILLMPRLVIVIDRDRFHAKNLAFLYFIMGGRAVIIALLSMLDLFIDCTHGVN